MAEVSKLFVICLKRTSLLTTLHPPRLCGKPDRDSKPRSEKENQQAIDIQLLADFLK